VLKAFGLEQYAVTGSNAKPVVLCYTINGAQLTSDLGHLTGSIKIVDPHAVDITTGNLLALTGKFQSRELFFVNQLAFVKDYKEVYHDCFRDFLKLSMAKALLFLQLNLNPNYRTLKSSQVKTCHRVGRLLSLGEVAKAPNSFVHIVWFPGP
jgi:hypothetical protein